MAYEEELADRFRKALGRTRDTSERKMMGGLCFFVKGHMIGAVDSSKQLPRRLIFRVGKPNAEEAVVRKDVLRLFPNQSSRITVSSWTR